MEGGTRPGPPVGPLRKVTQLPEEGAHYLGSVLEAGCVWAPRPCAKESCFNQKDAPFLPRVIKLTPGVTFHFLIFFLLSALNSLPIISSPLLPSPPLPLLSPPVPSSTPVPFSPLFSFSFFPFPSPPPSLLGLVWFSFYSLLCPCILVISPILKALQWLGRILSAPGRCCEGRWFSCPDLLLCTVPPWVGESNSQPGAGQTQEDGIFL